MGLERAVWTSLAGPQMPWQGMARLRKTDPDRLKLLSGPRRGAWRQGGHHQSFGPHDNPESIVRQGA